MKSGRRQQLRYVEQQIVAVDANAVTSVDSDEIVGLHTQHFEQRIDWNAEAFHRLGVKADQAVRGDADARPHVEGHTDALLDHALLSKLPVLVNGDLDAAHVRSRSLERARHDRVQRDQVDSDFTGVDGDGVTARVVEIWRGACAGGDEASAKVSNLEINLRGDVEVDIPHVDFHGRLARLDGAAGDGGQSNKSETHSSHASGRCMMHAIVSRLC